MSIRNWLIGVSVVATLGIVLILMQRFGAIDWPILRGAAGHASHGSGPAGAVNSPTTGDPTAALIDSLKREVETAKHPAPVRPASTGKDVSQPSHVKETPAGSGTNETPVTPAATEKPTTETAKAADTPEPEPSTYFGLSVASYLDIDRAREEKDKFVQSTTLPGIVMPYTDEGSTMYRIVLGRWASAGDAERASNALMERGLISEAHVVTIPKK